jgi:hypothetical protein
MKTFAPFAFLFAFCAGLIACAAAVPGSVEWSDGRKVDGDLSLTPGKDIRLFEVKTQASIRLEDVKEIAMTPEKEEMREGYYFTEAGQAAQTKTGEIYPVRYFKAKITLKDGKVLEGHLYTTVLYLEGAEKTEKVVLLAKQTGQLNQKIESIVYPKSIRLNVSGTTTATCRIDLTTDKLTGIRSITVISLPDLALLDAAPEAKDKPAWSIPFGDPKRVIFAVEAADGIHVAWPAANDPEAARAVEASLASSDMRDFYDKRTLLGCAGDSESGDVFSLVLMERDTNTHSFAKDKIPWTIAVLRWKYIPEEKKTTLLNRVMIATGRNEGSSKPPVVFKSADLLSRIALTHSKPEAAP